MKSMKRSNPNVFVARDDVLGKPVGQQEDAKMPRAWAVGGQRREGVDGRIGNERLTQDEFDDVLGMCCAIGECDHQADVVAY